jgi:hypothetical protein
VFDKFIPVDPCSIVCRISYWTQHLGRSGSDGNKHKHLAGERADLVALTETGRRAVDAVRIEDEVVRRVSVAAER